MSMRKGNLSISSIADGTKLTVDKGTVLKADCILDVHGHIKGHIKGNSVKIGPKGKIEGNLNCKFLEIYGEFTGNGEVVELKVCKGGRVKGSLSYNSIVVEVGATISGPMKPIEKDQVLLIENK